MVIERVLKAVQGAALSPSVKSMCVEVQSKAARHHGESEDLVCEAWVFRVLNREIA